MADDTRPDEYLRIYLRRVLRDPEAVEAERMLDTLIAAVRAENAHALTESVKLQAHYAELLNMHDGGQRMVFPTVEAWLERLRTR